MDEVMTLYELLTFKYVMLFMSAGVHLHKPRRQKNLLRENIILREKLKG